MINDCRRAADYADADTPRYSYQHTPDTPSRQRCRRQKTPRIVSREATPPRHFAAAHAAAAISQRQPASRRRCARAAALHCARQHDAPPLRADSGRRRRGCASRQLPPRRHRHAMLRRCRRRFMPDGHFFDADAAVLCAASFAEADIWMISHSGRRRCYRHEIRSQPADSRSDADAGRWPSADSISPADAAAAGYC